MKAFGNFIILIVTIMAILTAFLPIADPQPVGETGYTTHEYQMLIAGIMVSYVLASLVPEWIESIKRLKGNYLLKQGAMFAGICVLMLMLPESMETGTKKILVVGVLVATYAAIALITYYKKRKEKESEDPDVVE